MCIAYIVPCIYIHCVGEMQIFLNSKQDRQCAYNVTLRRVLATTVAVEQK